MQLIDILEKIVEAIKQIIDIQKRTIKAINTLTTYFLISSIGATIILVAANAYLWWSGFKSLFINYYGFIVASVIPPLTLLVSIILHRFPSKSATLVSNSQTVLTKHLASVVEAIEQLQKERNSQK